MNKLFAGFEEFIKDDRLTEIEVIIIKWQYGYFGSFYRSLIECFRKADLQNKERLSQAFPQLAEALDRYNQEEGFFEHCEKLAEKYKLNSQQ